MPWRECRPIDERIRLVARLLDGKKMAVVCRESGISRKTSYKLFKCTRRTACGGLDKKHCKCRYLFYAAGRLMGH